MIKILTILGARPQFIKAGSLSREFLKNDSIEEVILHTGQHYDKNMSDIFFEQMKLSKPDFNLNIVSDSHGDMTGKMIIEIEKIALKIKPDYILVYGDTNSTLAGAIVASKLDIKIAHVEAGLRSFNMKMPEEINRILTDRVSNLLFCPTKTSVKNLHNEGFKNFDCKVINSGDVMKDGIDFYKQFAMKPKYDLDEKFILATIHRAENTDDLSTLKSLIRALNTINKIKQVVAPLHPRTKKNINKHNLKIDFMIIEPIGYLEMIWMIDNCDLVMTDSGGLQKEAFFLHKNCIVLRNETEWTELTENGFNVLAGSDVNKILNLFNDYKFNKDFVNDLYGKGNASEIISKNLIKFNK